jgi:clan AA aspartic protease
MFMQGLIDADLVPRIENVFAIGNEEHFPLTCILDTGFNGECCLPRHLRDRLKLTPLHEARFKLADGSFIIEELFVGELIINDRPYVVEISFADTDETLLGMGLLKDKIAVFDLKAMRVSVNA